jgi:hypothetical protein
MQTFFYFQTLSQCNIYYIYRLQTTVVERALHQLKRLATHSTLDVNIETSHRVRIAYNLFGKKNDPGIPLREDAYSPSWPTRLYILILIIIISSPLNRHFIYVLYRILQTCASCKYVALLTTILLMCSLASCVLQTSASCRQVGHASLSSGGVR